MSNELKIEAGKYYLTENRRFYVCATNKPGVYPIVGWFDDGRIAMYPPNTDALISEWVEPERIPWEHLPKWCRWWVKQPCGTEWGTQMKPAAIEDSWLINDGKCGCIRLPEHLHSNYTGDWRNSLRERLEGV